MNRIPLTKHQRQRLDHLDRIDYRVYQATCSMIAQHPDLAEEWICHGLKVVLYKITHRDTNLELALYRLKKKLSAGEMGREIQILMGQEPQDTEAENKKPANSYWQSLSEEEKNAAYERALKPQIQRGPVRRSDTRFAG